MTIPSERTRAVQKTSRLMKALLRVPSSKWDKRAIKRMVSDCLRHYPSDHDFDDSRITSAFSKAAKAYEGEDEVADYMAVITLEKKS